MIISAIVAMNSQRIIGLNNQMPWHYPTEYNFFKHNVAGHFLLWGRKNWEANLENDVLLAQCAHLILTHEPASVSAWLPANFKYPYVASCDILQLLKIAKSCNESELFVVGGAELYQLTMPYWHRLYLSHVPYEGWGDTYFPAHEQYSWDLMRSSVHQSTSDSPSWKFELWGKDPTLSL